MEKKMEMIRMQNHVEKKMENDMEPGLLRSVGVDPKTLNPNTRQRKQTSSFLLGFL